MKRKLYITRTVKLTCFLLAVILTLSFLQAFLLRRFDQNSIRIEGYYLEEENSLDVVLIGASEVYTGFAAGKAYERYGFTSYPYATESITADGVMLTLKEVLRTQTPQLVMIELNPYLYSHDKNEKHEGHIRKLLDNVPLNGNKIEYINEHVANEDKMEYLFPLIKYHGLWTEYPKEGRRMVSSIKQRIRGTSYLKGFRTTTTIAKPEYPIYNDKLAAENGTKPLNANLEAKLKNLMDYCKSQNVNVVFFRTPHLVYKNTYDRVKRANRAAEIISSYGYDCINLERDIDKFGIDSKTDFYNYDHMNVYGAVKATTYLGELITRKYGVKPSKLEGEQKKRWDNAAKCFNQLYAYCDDLIKRGKNIRLEEDINTLKALNNY